jgi:hypothetical protein
MTIPHIPALIPSHVLCGVNKVAEFLANEGIYNPSKPMNFAWKDISEFPLQLACQSLALLDFNPLDWVPRGVCDVAKA